MNMFRRIPSGLLHKEQPKRPQLEPWEEERVREVLRATHRLTDFDVSDIAEDELREKVEIAARSRRMRYADFSITQERYCSAPRTGRSLIWDEVMK